jgi:hypothetical protein
MSEKELETGDSSENTLDMNTWRTTVTHRNKNRMKITFKLNQAESSAFQSFKDATQPDGLPEEDFIKSIFFLGLTTLERNVAERLAENMNVEDGEVSFEAPQEEEPVSDTDE